MNKILKDYSYKRIKVISKLQLLIDYNYKRTAIIKEL